jgi:acetyl-CoA carboxylase biotin carboxylase subunit
VKLANDAICIGDARSADSYLNIPSIISAAEIADVEAIHPGFGFLAENPHFAEICESCEIKFIGPKPEAIRLMGDKSLARDTMRKAGLPLIPGSKGVVKEQEEALRVAKKLTYPVIIKAKAGGGGKGMKVAHNDGTLVSAFMTARTEAEAAFGNPEVYIEKYVKGPRHIEVQIIADSFGHVVHLGERDCSIQRRHQKLVEEAPAMITEKLRRKMGEAAVRAAKIVNYENVGTVEFLVDEEEKFYFMEMNTRLQVEHPVTEIVTGVDIVKEQIRIAQGEKLSVTQDAVKCNGAAIECRINAEDPDNNFMPSPGRIEKISFGGGPHIRVDSHAYAGYEIPPFYDSMIAKMITWGRNRQEAIATMQRVLDETEISPVKTTIPLHKRIMTSPAFLKGKNTTLFIDKLFQTGKVEEE